MLKFILEVSSLMMLSGAWTSGTDAYLGIVMGSPRAGKSCPSSEESVTSATCELGQKHNPGILTPCPMPNDKDIHSCSLYLGIDIPAAKRVTSGHPVSSLCC